MSPSLPIVALTADLVSDVSDSYEAAGLDALLSKPFEINALMRTLSQFLVSSNTPKLQKIVS